VTLLLEDLSPQERNAPGAAETLRRIRDANRLHEPGNWWAALRDAPALLDYFFSHRRLIYLLRLREVLVILFAIVYLLSPFDLIPEAVFGVVGLIDDLAVLIFVVVFIAVIARHAIQR